MLSAKKIILLIKIRKDKASINCRSEEAKGGLNSPDACYYRGERDALMEILVLLKEGEVQ